MSLYPCPCCGSLTLAEPPPGAYDLCPVCGWVDGESANELGLAEARRNYQTTGASDPRFLDRARRPTRDEAPPMSPREEIAAVAQAMLDGRVGLHAGCESIAGLRHQLPEPEANGNELNLFVGIASELDDCPVSSERQYWEPAALADKDRKRDEYLNRVKEDLLNACRALAMWR